MSAENFEQALEELLSVTPFRVFTVELHGGRRFEIDHPRAVALKNGLAVFIAPGNVPIIFDHDSVNQITVAPANSAL